MPVELPQLNCIVDGDCQPGRINQTFVVAESVARSCDHQVFSRQAPT